LTTADVEPTLARLLSALEETLALGGGELLARYRDRDVLAGREIAWGGGSGRARGIDGEGRLVVELEGGGRTALSAGEVHLRTPGR
jgi:biotin-(acetyl-CoA carboxylase) ligase